MLLDKKEKARIHTHHLSHNQHNRNSPIAIDMGYICKCIINYRNHKIFHDIFLKNFIILLIIKKKC